MHKPAKPTYSFYARIDRETDERRRRLQELMRCSASDLVQQAFRNLEARINGDPNHQPSGAA